jgi:hypothetical protein
MLEAVRTSETSVNFNVTTRRYIPEDSKLHTRRRKNLKSHTINVLPQVAQWITNCDLRFTFTHVIFKQMKKECLI